MVGSCRARIGAAVFTTAIMVLRAHAAPSPLAQRVLILVNDNMPPEPGTNGLGASIFVGQYYADRRGIPLTNVVHVSTSTDEVISYNDYQAQIEGPLRTILDASNGSMRHQILYIAPIYGIPLKVASSAGTSALDSILSTMYSGFTTSGISIPNAYCSSSAQHCSLGMNLGAKPPHFDAWADQNQASRWKMFLVSRLDGPNARIAQGLVDKAIAAEPSLNLASGIGYFDYQGTRTPQDGGYYTADLDILSSANLSNSNGFATVLNTQANTVCGLDIHPASTYYWDPGTRNNLYVSSYGVQSAAKLLFPALAEGNVILGIHGSTNNTGNFAYIILGTSDPQTYIKLTYPLAPFAGWRNTDNIVLEKVIAGASYSTVVPVDQSMSNALNGVTEFRIHVENTSIAVSRNGVSLISLADTTGAPIQWSSVSIGSLCWDYNLTTLQVANKSGNVVFSDSFSSNTAANYQWSLPPLQGQNALWAWGWYGTAFDSYRFVPGAIGAQLTSYTAGTIRTPQNPDPAVASLDDRRWGPNWVPRMLEEGVTGTWGAVDEPYVQNYTSGIDFFSLFWAGYNFAESFYLANNVLRWTMVAVGDPLYAPQMLSTPLQPPPVYTISGAVSPATAGITMTLSGAVSASTTTSATGTYTFSGLANGTYTVTPGKTGYAFTPAAQPVIIDKSSQTANFVAGANPGSNSIDLYLTNISINSGSQQYAATNSITAGVGVTIGGSASVTFAAGSQIKLSPGFHAASGTATTTFRAHPN